MNIHTLETISPTDGRYADKTKDLRYIFSEFGLIKYRVFIEIRWLGGGGKGEGGGKSG